MDSIREEISSNHSDSDGWTLVSPPHSAPSSPGRLSPSQPSSSGSSLERLDRGDDGLTEIDLGGQSHHNNATIITASQSMANKADEDFDGRSSSAEPDVPGFQPLDTTTDDDCDAEADIISNYTGNESRRPSLTQSELDEYVDLGKGIKAQEETFSVKPGVAPNATRPLETTIGNSVIEHQENSPDEEDPDDRLASLRASLDELSSSGEHTSPSISRLLQLLGSGLSPQRSAAPAHDRLVKTFVLVSALVALALVPQDDSTSKGRSQQPAGRDGLQKVSDSNEGYRPDVLINQITSSQQYVELKLLHSELSQCIKRQSPSSFKYYMSEEARTRNSDQPQRGYSTDPKPYKSLVCYGQETQWRERFDRLRSEYNLDLRTMVQEAKNSISTDMLEQYHSSLQFKLILNQIEYLDFLENKRNKKQYEETIKYLKAENMQLLRRLNQPNETGYQKLVVSLELENSKLRRQNEALKANLVGKAGPAYIKQALELERYERENNMLKQFHNQVSQEVAKSLKQFNLHTSGATIILDDHESLKSQIASTRCYLRRFSEKISSVLLENQSLKDELKEVYLTAANNNVQDTKSVGAHNHLRSALNMGRQARQVRQVDGAGNNSNALMSDGCMRNLVKLQERSSRLESEVERLRRDCNSASLVASSAPRAGGAELQRSSDRQLNKTEEAPDWPVRAQPLLGWDPRASRRLAPLRRSELQTGQAASTALDKRTQQTLLTRDDRMIDELLIYLTKFNNQIEELNGLALVQERQPQMSTGRRLAQSEESKTIPIYIREAVRVVQGVGRGSGEQAANDLDIDYDSESPDRADSIHDQLGRTSALPTVPPTSSMQPMRRPRHANEQLDNMDENANSSANMRGVELSASSFEKEETESATETNTNTNTTSDTLIGKQPIYQRAENVTGDVSETPAAAHGRPANIRRDSWFFKRAKQRKHLRRSLGANAQPGQPDWMTKRAKLREKLRRASSYIEDLYLASTKGRKRAKWAREGHSGGKRVERSRGRSQQRNVNVHGRQEL